MHRRILALALAGATVAASAQILGAPPGTPEQRSLPDTPEWKELDAPPPPALRTSGLIAIDVPGTSLHFGVDPASITVGKDRIVRYVVVATSNSGAGSGVRRAAAATAALPATSNSSGITSMVIPALGVSAVARARRNLAIMKQCTHADALPDPAP